MNQTPSRSTGLAVHRLRALSLDPAAHPRGQPHLSAASGLVCANGLAYVIADDEHHVAVFRDRRSPGELHRIVPGDLPHGKKKRKKRKPDMETLLLLPASRDSAGGALMALGSGSRANRNVGVVIPLGATGEPARGVRRFDLDPLYRPLRALLGEINIEGAMVIGDEFVLLHRAVADRAGNATVRFRLRDIQGLIDGERSDLVPLSTRRYDLGAIDGVALGFTDGAARPDGGWVFTAVAENTADSVADGTCAGSAVGAVDARGDLQWLRLLEKKPKVEGIDLRVAGASTTICMVTDSDDPARCSWLLLAQL